jgi:nitrate reductase beta subunit
MHLTPRHNPKKSLDFSHPFRYDFEVLTSQKLKKKQPVDNDRPGRGFLHGANLKPANLIQAMRIDQFTDRRNWQGRARQAPSLCEIL